MPGGHWKRFISIPVIRAVSRKHLPGSFGLVYAADEKEGFVHGLVWFAHPKLRTGGASPKASSQQLPTHFC